MAPARLLRKPRAPKPLEPPDPPAPPKSVLNVITPNSFSVAGTSERISPPPSLHPSVVSPPPPSELQSHLLFDTYSSPSHHGTNILRKGDLKYVLDPMSSTTGWDDFTETNTDILTESLTAPPNTAILRERTQLGTYVEGRSLIKPYKPRGPDGLPARPPKRPLPIIPLGFLDADESDERYKQPPKFTLHDFAIHVSEVHHVPLHRVKQAVYSRHNFKKFYELLLKDLKPQRTNITNIVLEPSEDMPHVTPRIPQKQLLIEMAALVKEQMSTVMKMDMRTVIRSLPKYSPSYPADAPAPHTEILLYEKGTQNPLHRQQFAQNLNMDNLPNLPPTDTMLQASSARYFQGSRRSNSPFGVRKVPPAFRKVQASLSHRKQSATSFYMGDGGEAGADDMISPAELAVLDALMNGGTALSLKANFVSVMPDVEPLQHTLTYLNLSFNDFRAVPFEVFSLINLTTFKFRNNPCKEVPHEIACLTRLQVLVFSFCMVSSLPISLFSLPELRRLDLGFNRLSYLPNEIKKLKNLTELNLEGNQLSAMPAGCLRLTELQSLRVKNNMMHPLFWQENSQYEPLRLLDMTAKYFKVKELGKHYRKLMDHIHLIINNYTTCECCQGPLFGPGLRVIRPVNKIFGVKHLPIMFHCCSPSCRDEFMKNTESLTSLLYGDDAVVLPAIEDAPTTQRTDDSSIMKESVDNL